MPVTAEARLHGIAVASIRVRSQAFLPWIVDRAQGRRKAEKHMGNVTVIRGKGPRPEHEHHRGARERIEEGLEHITQIPTNLSMGERHLSLAIGGVLAGIAIGNRRPITGGILGSLGAYLLARGATGHCYLYETLGIQTCAGRDTDCSFENLNRSIAQHEHDNVVDEASEESMVASDPPAYTPTTGTGGQ